MVALALDAELHLRHLHEDIDGILKTFDAMRELRNRGSVEATCVCNMGLAIGVLFGMPEEALTAARAAVNASEGRSP